MPKYFFQITFNGTKGYFEGFNHSRVIVTSGPVLTYKVENLFPGTTYTFALRAQSLCGIGESSNRVVVETIEDCKSMFHAHYYTLLLNVSSTPGENATCIMITNVDKKRGVSKTRNMEDSGTFRNIPDQGKLSQINDKKRERKKESDYRNNQITNKQTNNKKTKYNSST